LLEHRKNPGRKKEEKRGKRARTWAARVVHPWALEGGEKGEKKKKGKEGERKYRPLPSRKEYRRGRKISSCYDFGTCFEGKGKRKRKRKKRRGGKSPRPRALFPGEKGWREGKSKRKKKRDWRPSITLHADIEKKGKKGTKIEGEKEKKGGKRGGGNLSSPASSNNSYRGMV